MKKFWQITGTNITGETKAELKADRDRLNISVLCIKDNDKLEDFPSNTWPHRITKGPEHPHLMPFFREVRLNAVFSHNGTIYKKVADLDAKTLTEGILGLVVKKFTADQQVSLV